MTWRRSDLREQIEQLTADLATERNLVATYRHMAATQAAQKRTAEEAHQLTLERALTAETLLAQLHRLAGCGEPPRERGRVAVHAMATSLSRALAAGIRHQPGRPPRPGPPADPAARAGDVTLLLAAGPPG